MTAIGLRRSRSIRFAGHLDRAALRDDRRKKPRGAIRAAFAFPRGENAPSIFTKKGENDGMSLRLTDRQSTILDFIRERLEGDGHAPTLEEIGKHLGLAHVSAVSKHLHALEAKGHLTIAPNRPRGIRLKQDPEVVDPELLDLPLIGRIEI